MIDVGHGDPLVLIPGIQGRWEWMAPAVDALAEQGRVLTFSYVAVAGSKDPAYGGHLDGSKDPSYNNLDLLVEQVRGVMDAAGVERAAICGVSFGGFVAARFAAAYPARVSALIIVSSPSPHWAPDPTLLRYMERPLLSMPVVLPAWFMRMWPEIFAALPTLGARARFAAGYLGRMLRAPLSVTKMTAWARLKMATDIVADCARVTAPALLITGDPALDRVVDAQKSRDWIALILGMRHVTMEGTGHIGLVTQPDRFAGIVRAFIKESSSESSKESST